MDLACCWSVVTSGVETEAETELVLQSICSCHLLCKGLAVLMEGGLVFKVGVARRMVYES